MLNTISEGERSIFKRKAVLEHKLIFIMDIFVIQQPLSMQQTYQNLGTFVILR